MPRLVQFLGTTDGVGMSNLPLGTVKKSCKYSTQPKNILRSRHIRVNLQAYERKMTDKREQYDWRAKKILHG